MSRLAVLRGICAATATREAAAWSLGPACRLTSRRPLAGHSHWAKIKRAKGSNDAQRAVLFAKISSEIIAATRAAGGDVSNIRVQAAITKAKANNMSKSTIDNALKRGVEAKAGATLEVVTYEGMGPGSVAVIIEALTDNRKRTAPAVRHIFSKCGGSLGTSNSVSWMFERKGYLEVQKKSGQDSNDLLEAALEAGADDVEEDDGDAASSIARVYCPLGDLAMVRKALEDQGFTVPLVSFIYKPKQYTEVSADDASALATMLGMFDDDPDVQEVFHNAADPEDASTTAAA